MAVQAHAPLDDDAAGDEVEFSDDEKEAEYRRATAAQAGPAQPNQAPQHGSGRSMPQGRGRGVRSPDGRGRGGRQGGRTNRHRRPQPAYAAEQSILGPPPQMLVHQVWAMLMRANG